MTTPMADPADTLAVLKASEEWLSDKSHWIQGNFWRDVAGFPTNTLEAVASTCGEGALSYVAGCPAARPPSAAYEALAEAIAGEHPVTVVNDRTGGYERIMAGLRKAIETLEAKR